MLFWVPLRALAVIFRTGPGRPEEPKRFIIRAQSVEGDFVQTGV